MSETATVISIDQEREVESVQISAIVKAEKESPLKLAEALTQISTFTVRKNDGTYAVAVTNNQQSDLAENVRKVIESERKKIWDDMSPEVKLADALHDRLVERRRAATAPYDALKAGIVAGNKAYLRKLEEERQAEQRRIAEIARKEAEERALAEAEALEREGRHEEAAQVIEEPPPPPPVIPSYAPKVDNRTYAVRYKARLVNKMDLIRFVARNPAFEHLLDYNEAQGNNLARAQKESMRIDGVVVVKE